MELSFVSVRLLFVLLIMVGIVVLQIFLSKRENKWAGRILPLIFFVFSLIIPLNMSAIAEPTAAFWIDLILIWFIACTPALVLWGIYLACRSSRRNRQEIDKMNIQDLD